MLYRWVRANCCVTSGILNIRRTAQVSCFAHCGADFYTFVLYRFAEISALSVPRYTFHGVITLQGTLTKQTTCDRDLVPRLSFIYTKSLTADVITFLKVKMHLPLLLSSFVLMRKDFLLMW